MHDGAGNHGNQEEPDDPGQHQQRAALGGETVVQEGLWEAGLESFADLTMLDEVDGKDDVKDEEDHKGDKLEQQRIHPAVQFIRRAPPVVRHHHRPIALVDGECINCWDVFHGGEDEDPHQGEDWEAGLPIGHVQLSLKNDDDTSFNRQQHCGPDACFQKDVSDANVDICPIETKCILVLKVTHRTTD